MENTDYFSTEFQFDAVKALLEDSELMGQIYPVLDQNYFSEPSLRNIVAVIKEYYKETGRVPDYTTLKVKCKDKTKGINYCDIASRIIQIKSGSTTGQDAIKDHMIKYFTLKEIVKMSKQIEEGVKMNDSTDAIIKKTMKQIDKISKIGDVQGTETALTSENIERALSVGDNETVTTGIPELDEAMAGGLGRQEIGLFVAPTGYGKTTMATVLASNAAMAGYKVIQIYFEDKPDDIIRKHIAKLSCTSCDMLKMLDKDQIEVFKKNMDINGKLDAVMNNLRMVRMTDGETTAEDIEELIRRHINEDFRPDLVIIDYFSSLKHSTNQYKSAFDAQPRCMRKIKEMAHKYNLAVWVMQQTNRTAVTKDGDSGSMGNIQGSYEATQPCSVWLTLSRTPEQKANHRANIIFNKTRHSQPKTNLENILFDNSRLDIRMDSQSGPADEAIWDDSYQSRVAQMVADNYNSQQSQW